MQEYAYKSFGNAKLYEGELPKLKKENPLKLNLSKRSKLLNNASTDEL